MDKMSVKPKFMKCFVTHITVANNEIEIWCQTDSTSCSRVETALQCYHSHLSDLFAINSQHLSPIPVPEVAKYYLTHMKNDLHFYRVVVTHVEPECNQALVLYIDFGLEEWIPFNQLVVCDQLFDANPLAQKYYLADIKPKPNKDWDLDKVKACLKPALLSTFQCEVIRITSNTECIRVYDQFFKQPLVEELVKQCDGMLAIDKSDANVLKAIDLTIDNRLRIEDMNPNDSQISNEINSNESITSESYPRIDESFVHNLKTEDKENLKNKESFRSKATDEEFESNEEIFENETKNIDSEYDSQLKYKSDDLSIGSKTIVEEVKIENKVKSQTDDSDPTDESVEGLAQTELKSSPEAEPIKEKSDCNSVQMIPKIQELNEKQTNVCDKSPNEVIVNGNQSSEDLDNNESNQKTIVAEVNENDGKTQSHSKDIQSEERLPELNLEVDQESDESSVPRVESNGVPEVKTSSDPIAMSGDEKSLLASKNKIFVTAAHPDQTFHCQLETKFDQISELTAQMTEYYDSKYESNEHRLCLSDLKKGDVIASRFSLDNLWYRAAVKVVNPKSLDVLYIDYGNDETVDALNCRSLVQKFKGMPPQAIHCHPIGLKISFDTLREYESNANEIDCEFVSLENGIYKINVISVKP